MKQHVSRDNYKVAQLKCLYTCLMHPLPLILQDESGSVNQTQSGNPLNVDPPQSLGDFVSSLNDSVNQYAQLVETYLEQANQTMAANLIGDSVINAVSPQKTIERGENEIT